MDRPNEEELGLDLKEINKLEQRRLDRLAEAGIDEGLVLEEANQNLNTWQSYFNENIVRGKDDTNFAIRDQWTAVERSEFARLFKPAMTFNKSYDPVKKTLAECRKERPDLEVRSLTGKASQDEIDIRADMVRTISYQSQNDLIYQSSIRSACLMGFGGWQVVVDYETPRSMKKIIGLELIPDITRTSFDPAAVKPHKGDGNWCSRQYVFRRDEFFARYPYIDNPSSYVDPFMLLDFQWQTRDTIVVCDFYKKEWFPFLLYRLSNGMEVTEDQWDEMEKEHKKIREIAGDNSASKDLILSIIPKIQDERQSQDYHLMHYRLIRDTIIDFQKWPGKHLPIIFNDGDSSYIEGRQYTKSMIHDARDAQKCVNYIGSEIIAEIKNRRREQWLGTPDNIIGYEQDWRNPETQLGMLKAKPDPKTGLMPTKMPAWELSPGLLENMQRASQDLREIIGISENQEIQGRDISGKARRERKMEGDLASYIYRDNLNQAIEQCGRVILDLLPAVYGGEERHMVLSKKNGESKPVILNQRMKDGSIKNEIKAGDYDIEIAAGPSFAVQKEIALEFLQQTLTAFPQAFPLIADLWAKNLDVQFMPQIASRFESLVPPPILAKEKGEPAPPQGPPSPQDQMAHAELENKQQEIQNKRAEIASRTQELALRQKEYELEEQELILKSRQLNNEIEESRRDHAHERSKHALEAHKADTDYSVKIANLLANLHKNEQKGTPT